MLAAFVRVGRLTVIDADGKRHVFSGSPGLNVTMRLTDKSLYHWLVFNPELTAGEAYMDGRMSFEDSTLRDFLALFSINRRALRTYPIQKVLRWISRRLKRFQQANPIGKAQANVAHHYDLGNDFYRLFLDEGMQYSCAYFLDDGETLEQAQTNKLRLLATLADVQVVGVTLSREQHLGAVDRAEAAGLSDRVRFELKDYRLVEGRFDRIVSVGMFEHVGVRHYGEFFAKIDALLTDDGIALVHSIGHMSPPGIASPWLRRYIFPGAYSPSLSEVFEATEKQRLWVTDLEFLRLHYAKTLAHWGRRFEANRDRVIAMYDENFARMWEFYLISAEMMFTTGNQLVFHLQLARKRDAAPLTRDYITDLQRTYRRLESERSGPGNID
jgi:cyclopropane-fatty-acyl-phospholipid synthase